MAEILQKADAARAEGISMLRLETHVRIAGCLEIGSFGKYRPDPPSALVEKRLPRAETG